MAPGKDEKERTEDAGAAAPPGAPRDKPGDSTTDVVIPGLTGLDLSKLGLTELIQVQNRISRMLKRRFESERALAFTDVAGSTAYFQRFGDEAGRRLVQRHVDLISRAVGRTGGRVVDTAGDGAFTCFPSSEAAANALIDVLRRSAHENAALEREHRLRLRGGIHFGTVLADERCVTGDAVNFSARIAGTAEPGEIRLSEAALRGLPPALRIRCRAAAAATFKGIEGAQPLWALGWQEHGDAPRRFRISETDDERALPDREVIRFGRLATIDDQPANDVVLDAGDAARTQKISRWHFELERLDDGGLLLRQGSGQVTEVDGARVPKGGTAPIRAGSIVRIGGVLTITFLSDDSPTVGGAA